MWIQYVGRLCLERRDLHDKGRTEMSLILMAGEGAISMDSRETDTKNPALDQSATTFRINLEYEEGSVVMWWLLVPPLPCGLYLENKS